MAEDKKDPKKEKLEQEKKLSELKKQAQVSSPVTKQMDELMRRLRLLEERYSGLRKKTQFTEQNMLKDAKELFLITQKASAMAATTQFSISKKPRIGTTQNATTSPQNSTKK